MTLGYASNDDDIAKINTQDANPKNNKRKRSDQQGYEDIHIDSEDDSCSEGNEYYDTSEIEDDDDDDDEVSETNKDDEDEDEEGNDRWDMDSSKCHDYSDWLSNDMINDYTIIGVKNHFLYADILRHIRKHTIYWMQNSCNVEDRDVYKFERNLQPREPEVGIETAKRRYHKAVDRLLVPSIQNQDRWMSYKVRCEYLQAMREFLWTMRQHCERELFLQWAFGIEQLPDPVRPVSVVAMQKYFKALERCVRSVLDFREKLSPSGLLAGLERQTAWEVSVQPWR